MIFVLYFILWLVFFCRDVIESYVKSADADFLQYIFTAYKKPIDFTANDIFFWYSW